MLIFNTYKINNLGASFITREEIDSISSIFIYFLKFWQILGKNQPNFEKIEKLTKV